MPEKPRSAELPPSSVIEQDEQDCDSYDSDKNCQFFIRWFAELKICHKQDTDHCHCNMQCIQKPVISRKYQRYYKERGSTTDMDVIGSP